MTDKTFPQQKYFSAKDCQTLYPPGTPYGNDHPNGWQDMADRLNALVASRLPAPTVVVPEPTSDEWRMIAENAGCADMVDFLAGAEAYGLWLRKNARAIPADRVPGDGMVAVDRQLLLDVEDVLGRAEGLGPCGLGLLCQVQDSLRANQGGA